MPTSTSTRSPCIAEPTAGGGMKISPESLCLETRIESGGIGGDEAEAVAMHAQLPDYSFLPAAALGIV